MIWFREQWDLKATIPFALSDYGATAIVTVLVSDFRPLRAVKSTMKSPEVVYTFFGLASLLIFMFPKFQSYFFAPSEVFVNLTSWPVFGYCGDHVKLAVGFFPQPANTTLKNTNLNFILSVYHCEIIAFKFLQCHIETLQNLVFDFQGITLIKYIISGKLQRIHY